jgi:hypothetical protein
LFRSAAREGFFVIRQHAQLPLVSEGKLRGRGRTESGEVFDQSVTLRFDGQEAVFRRIVVRLDTPTAVAAARAASARARLSPARRAGSCCARARVAGRRRGSVRPRSAPCDERRRQAPWRPSLSESTSPACCRTHRAAVGRFLVARNADPLRGWVRSWWPQRVSLGWPRTNIV